MEGLKIPEFKSRGDIYSYLHRLTGKEIEDSRMIGMSTRILSLKSIERRSQHQDLPDLVEFITIDGTINIDFLVCVQLIENPDSDAQDMFGFKYRIVK